LRSEVFQASYTMFTRRDRHGDRSQLQLWLPLSRNRVHSVSHELNMFNSCDRVCNCSTDYTIWSQSHWPAKWCNTWNVEETLKLTSGYATWFTARRGVQSASLIMTSLMTS